MLVDFAPDGWGNINSGPGTALDILDSNYEWHPGGKLPPDLPHQINEQEYMKEDEYDLFLLDPSDYIIRYWIDEAAGKTPAPERPGNKRDRFRYIFRFTGIRAVCQSNERGRTGKKEMG